MVYGIYRYGGSAWLTLVKAKLYRNSLFKPAERERAILGHNNCYVAAARVLRRCRGLFFGPIGRIWYGY